MKLYIGMRNKFFAISIVLLILSLIFLLIFKNEPFGYFLLGLFASTSIITFQSNMSAQVEESRLLIEKLKKMADICYDFHEFNTFSVDFFALDFEKKFYGYKEKIEKILELNNELGNISDLNNKTKNQLKPINKKLSKLQLDLHFIFKEFGNQSNKMKIIYFMEFYKIIKQFDFKNFQDMIYLLGWKIDSKEIFKSDYQDDIESKITNLEYNTSVPVYNERIEQNNAIEYKALKSKFEKFMKN